MKNKIAGIVGLIVVIFLFTSGLFGWCTSVFVWLITLNNSSPSISVFGQLFVKYATWIVAFSMVGIIFKRLNWFNSDAMKLVYFIISTIISFVLSYVVMVLEDYVIYVAMVLGTLILTLIVIIIILYIKRRKQKNKGENDEFL